MSADEFVELLDAQGGVCAICKRPSNKEKSGRAFHIDHDKTTKMVRGLLCYNCNYGLGRFQSNPAYLEAAIEYLRKAPAAKLETRPRARYERESKSGNLKRFDGSPPTRRTAKRPQRNQPATGG